MLKTRQDKTRQDKTRQDKTRQDKTRQDKYSYCISLGWYCGTASALSRLGLRSASGPFDWVHSELWNVVEMIRTEFAGFAQADNLELWNNSEKICIDKVSEFRLCHDIQENLDLEREAIADKYRRRAERFLSMIESPTVFFRTVEDEREVEYINEHWAEIDALLKHYNEENRIIYILLSKFGELSSAVESYRLDWDIYSGKNYEMRHLFDTSAALMGFCQGLLPEEVMEQNRLVDEQHNGYKNIAGYVQHWMKLEVDDMAAVDDIARANGVAAVDDIARANGVAAAFRGCIGPANSGVPVYLYGAGKYGTRMAYYLEKQGIRICAFLDSQKTGLVDEHFLIVSLDEVKDGATTFITVANEDDAKEIQRMLSLARPDLIVRTYRDLYKDFPGLIRDI